MLMAAGGIWIASRMDRGYLQVLERGLLNRAVELDAAEIQDSTTLSAIRAVSPVAARPNESGEVRPADTAPARNPGSDPSIDRLRELRSGEVDRVRRALADDSFQPILVSQVIRLLAWNEMSEHARHYLTVHATRVVGQLTDALLDSDQDFAVRRRIPRILARCPSQRAVDGLTDALNETRFEIRFQAGRALEYLHRENTGLRFDTGTIMTIVERELSVSRPIWEGRRLLEHRDGDDYSYLDDVLRDRANQSLEHVFSLLAITLPREPLQVAFRALHSEDRMLRGLGLEYLETTLPARVFRNLSGLLESDSTPEGRRDPHVVLQELMHSQPSILLKLKIPSDDAASPDATPPTATRS
jgi:hypothetical protein